MKPSSYGPFPYSPIIRRPRLEWPDGAHVALWIIPNIEYFSLEERPGGYGAGKVPDVVMWSERDYGNRVGVFRLMETLDRYGIRGTVALNSNLCAEHPEIIEEGNRRKWEWMGHNESNTRRLNEAAPGEEEEIIRRTLATIEQHSGKRPVGWLSAGLQETWDTLDHLAAHGVRYVGDWCNDDQPYTMSLEGGRSMLAMPYTQQLNDKSAIERRFVEADGFRQMICDQFDVLYHEGAKSGRVMAIALHPYLIGVPHRIGALDAALKYICKHRKVWKATGSEIAQHYLAQMEAGMSGTSSAKTTSTRTGRTKTSRGSIPMNRVSHTLAATLLLAAGLAQGPQARAADAVTVGTVGSASANLWPVFIGMRKGFFEAENLKFDVVYVQSSANLVQQLAAGSLDITMSTGLVDPIRAIVQRAPLAIARFEVQAPPYAISAKPGIASLKDLKGKVISLGGPKDITKIYVERMLAPHGIKPGEFDMVFAGATSARASALQAGAVDAAILLPPFNFHATAAGFNELGLTIDYAPELPFSGTVVNRNWAARNQPLLSRLLTAHGKAVAWFYEPGNRAEAVRMMAEVSRIKPEDVEKAYDFFVKGKFFEPTGAISRAKLNALVTAMQQLGDLPTPFDTEQLVLAGVTKMSD